MMRISSDAEVVKKRAMSGLQSVHDMAANDRRATAAKADLISVRKKRSNSSGLEPVYVNRETIENRTIVLVENGPCGDGPVKDASPKACGPFVLNEELMKPMKGPNPYDVDESPNGVVHGPLVDGTSMNDGLPISYEIGLSRKKVLSNGGLSRRENGGDPF